MQCNFSSPCCYSEQNGSEIRSWGKKSWRSLHQISKYRAFSADEVASLPATLPFNFRARPGNNPGQLCKWDSHTFLVHRWGVLEPGVGPCCSGGVGWSLWATGLGEQLPGATSWTCAHVEQVGEKRWRAIGDKWFLWSVCPLWDKWLTVTEGPGAVPRCPCACTTAALWTKRKVLKHTNYSCLASFEKSGR